MFVAVCCDCVQQRAAQVMLEAALGAGYIPTMLRAQTRLVGQLVDCVDGFVRADSRPKPAIERLAAMGAHAVEKCTVLLRIAHQHRHNGTNRRVMRALSKASIGARRCHGIRSQRLDHFGCCCFSAHALL